jgi:hypothetical protein
VRVTRRVVLFADVVRRFVEECRARKRLRANEKEGEEQSVTIDSQEESAIPTRSMISRHETSTSSFLSYMDTNLFPYQCLSIPVTPRIIELLKYGAYSLR